MFGPTQRRGRRAMQRRQESTAMFFNIDADNGKAITGWFAPDNPSLSTRIAVVVPGREEVQVDADRLRKDIVDLGMHATGRVGFRIDRDVLPDIEQIYDIELLEAETRLPIYRRFHAPEHMERKLFLFEASLMPQRSIQASLRRHFALNYFSSERHSLETLIVVINNSKARSIVISGRSHYKRYVSYLDSAGFVKAIMLRDPFEELAERLLFLSLLSQSNASHLAPEFSTGVAPLLAFASDLPFTDAKALLARFRQLTSEQRQALSSPTVKMLACDVDEQPVRKHMTIALEHLAALDVVGVRARYPAFRAILAQTLGADVLDDEPPTTFPAVKSLAATLSRIGVVAALIEQDLALYSYAEEAINIGLAGRDVNMQRDSQAI